LNFLNRFPEKSQTSNLIKICLVGAELSHADGRTDKDMTKLIVTFCNFANAPKMCQIKVGHSIDVTIDVSVSDAAFMEER
jgi:hypothetical protein